MTYMTLFLKKTHSCHYLLSEIFFDFVKLFFTHGQYNSATLLIKIFVNCEKKSSCIYVIRVKFDSCILFQLTNNDMNQSFSK